MLKQRLLTALVLVPLVVWAVIALPWLWFAAGLGVVLAVGAWEWSRLIGLGAGAPRVLYTVGVLAGMGVLGYAALGEERVLLVLLAGVLLWWLLAARWVRLFPGGAPDFTTRVLAGAAIGLVVLVSTWLALVALRLSPSHGASYLLFLLVLIWVADSGAYMAGKRWGNRKLAPQVSPGKTWEGVWGAMIATVLAALAGAGVLGIAPGEWPLFVALCVITVAFSIVGDLLVSLLKRQAGVKDSSELLPGHGGIMDRLDSLTAAAPVFMLGLLLLRIPS